MKRYNEMSREELVALTDDQVRKLIEIEVMVAGIKPVDPPIEPTLESEGITANVIGYKVGDLIFLDEKDARIVADLPAMKTAYSYHISYKYCWLEKMDARIEKVAFYRQDDVMRIATVLKENESRREIYNRQKQTYEEFLRQITGLSDAVWQAFREALDRQRAIDGGKRAYQKYLSLADGDHQVAQKFFRDAFKDDAELVGIVITAELPPPQMALPLDDAVSNETTGVGSGPEQKGDANAKE